LRESEVSQLTARATRVHPRHVVPRCDISASSLKAISRSRMRRSTAQACRYIVGAHSTRLAWSNVMLHVAAIRIFVTEPREHMSLSIECLEYGGQVSLRRCSVFELQNCEVPAPSALCVRCLRFLRCVVSAPALRMKLRRSCVSQRVAAMRCRFSYLSVSHE
jgi:hypothetical protein